MLHVAVVEGAAVLPFGVREQRAALGVAALPLVLAAQVPVVLRALDVPVPGATLVQAVPALCVTVVQAVPAVYA